MEVLYNFWIVGLSYIVASVASYCALDMARRVSEYAGTPLGTAWLAVGSTTMGLGIWSMHFIGMLAFSLPIEVHYDIVKTGLSVVFAIAASAIALYTVSSGELNKKRLIISGIFMGAGICLMHYTGMMALKIFPLPTYDPLLFALSVVIAITASIAAMWICFNLNLKKGANIFWIKIGSALVMGVAIWGMHFTGMAAAIFDADAFCVVEIEGVHNAWLAGAVSIITCLFLGAALIVSGLDSKANAEKRALQHQSDALFNSSGDLICICDFEGNFVRINPSLCRLLDYEHDILIKKPFMAVIHADDRAYIAKVVAELERGIPDVDIPCRLECSNGSYVATNWTANPADDGLTFYALGRDLTELNKQKARIEEVNRQLVKASRDAGKAEVASNVLHNIGNTLNSINVSVETVKATMSRSRAASLGEISDMFAVHSHDLPEFLANDPKGKLIPTVLTKLSWRWTMENKSTDTEVEALQRHIAHLKKVIALQEGLVGDQVVLEEVDIKEVVLACTNRCKKLITDSGVDLHLELAEHQLVMTDREMLSNIVLSLIKHTVKSYENTRVVEKPLLIKLLASGDNTSLSIWTEGVGQAQGVGENLFAQKISADTDTDTDTDNLDLLLHECAVNAASLGVRLDYKSHGKGRAACFYLIFSVKDS